MIDRKIVIDNLLGYTPKSIVLSKLEQADKTNATYSIHPREYPMFEMNNIPVPVDDGNVIYSYNELGFRCDTFDNNENKILLIGCSEGEGLGDTLDKSWPKQVFDSIKNLYNAEKFYNISVDNFGYQKIISNCMAWINHYGNPKAIVLLFPEITRTVSWDTTNKDYTVKWSNGGNIETDEEIQHLMDSMINFIGLMHVFEKLCETNDIDLYWSTWSSNENLIFTELNIFNNFIRFDYGIYNNSPLRDEQIKRDGHQGNYHHSIWSSNLSTEIRKKVLTK